MNTICNYCFVPRKQRNVRKSSVFGLLACISSGDNTMPLVFTLSLSLTGVSAGLLMLEDPCANFR
jgi:hypothetical protein